MEGPPGAKGVVMVARRPPADLRGLAMQRSQLAQARAPHSHSMEQQWARPQLLHPEQVPLLLQGVSRGSFGAMTLLHVRGAPHDL